MFESYADQPEKVPLPPGPHHSTQEQSPLVPHDSAYALVLPCWPTVTVKSSTVAPQTAVPLAQANGRTTPLTGSAWTNCPKTFGFAKVNQVTSPRVLVLDSVFPLSSGCRLAMMSSRRTGTVARGGTENSLVQALL